MPDIEHTYSIPLSVGTILNNYKVKKFLYQEADAFVYLAEKLPNLHKKKHAERDSILVLIKEFFLKECCVREEDSLNVSCESAEQLREFEKALIAFKTMAIRLGHCSHPGLPSVTHLFPENGTIYVVMNYVNGYSFETLLSHQGKRKDWFASEDEVRLFLWRLLDTLSYVHRSHIYHYALRPKFITLDSEGNPIIGHFSANDLLINVLQKADDSEELVYFAPEQWDEFREWGAQADLYAVGAMFYRLLTSELPQLSVTRRLNDEMIILAHNEDLSLNYSATLLASIDKALSLDPKNRFSSAEEWKKEFEGQKRFIKPYWEEPDSLWFKRGRRFVYIGVPCLFLLGAGWLAYEANGLFDQQDDEPEEAKIISYTLSTGKRKSTNLSVASFYLKLKDRGFGINTDSFPQTVVLDSCTVIAPDSVATMPAVHLVIRDEGNAPLAISLEAHKLTKSGAYKFTFGNQTVLDTNKVYSYTFVTDSGAAVCVPLLVCQDFTLFQEGSGGILTDSFSKIPQIPMIKLEVTPQTSRESIKEHLPQLSAMVYGSPRNWCLHPDAKASQSSVQSTSEASLAIDGQVGGNMSSMTNSFKGKGWWQVVFGEGIERPVKKVVIYPLGDGSLLSHRRLSNFKVVLYDKEGKVVAEKSFYTEGQNWVKETEIWRLDNVVAVHTARVIKLGCGAYPDDEALALEEIQLLPPESEDQGATGSHGSINWAIQPGAIPSQSSICHQWKTSYGPMRALTGSESEKFYSHTEENNSPAWWKVDFDTPHWVNGLTLTNLTEFKYDHLRLSNFMISFYDEVGQVVLQKSVCVTQGDYLPPCWNWEFPYVRVKTIRISKQGKGAHPFDNALSLPQLKIWGK